MSNTTQNSRKKNLLTSIVAGAAGIALLAGGASFALWTDSANSAQAVVTTGSLDIDPGNQRWYDGAESTVSEEGALGDFRMVPGDSVRIEQDLDITVEGDNLKAALAVNDAAAAITGDFASSAICSISIKNAPGGLTGSCDTVLDSVASSVPLALPSSSEAQTVTAVVKITFPSSATAEMKKSLTINPVTFTLTQI